MVQVLLILSVKGQQRQANGMVHQPVMFYSYAGYIKTAVAIRWELPRPLCVGER